MSPLEIEILLHYYYTGGENFPKQSLASDDYHEKLVQFGALQKQSDGTYAKKGDLIDNYVRFITSIPLMRIYKSLI